MAEVAAIDPQAKLAARAQFPRRVILLLVAFALAWVLILGLRGLMPELVRTSGGGSRMAEIVRQRLPASLGLLAVSLVLTLIQTAVITFIAITVHRLEAKNGPLGSVLKGLGRLWVFGQAAAPVFVLAVIAIYLFVFQLRLFPAVGGGLRGVFPPAICLALLPTTLTAQVIAREVTLPREPGSGPVWPAALLKGAAALVGQTGGVLCNLVLVELVFAWPGMGRAFIEAWMRLDLGIAIDVAVLFTALTLLGRLAAELFKWLARLRPAPPAVWPEPTTSWRKTARRLWLAAALVLLVGPICVALTGLVTNPEAALERGLADRNEGPSAEHFLGTDSLGRDVWARVSRGGAVTLGTALLAAVVAAIPGGLAGALAGWFAARRTLQGETLADLVLLPAEALSLIPAIPLAILLAILFGPGSWLGVAGAVALVLAPRLAHYLRGLWQAGPDPKPAMPALLAGIGSLLLAAWFASLSLIAGLDFLGFGVRPPTPTLGGMLADALNTQALQGGGGLASAGVLVLCALAFFTAASALAGFFPTKEPLVRLNE